MEDREKIEVQRRRKGSGPKEDTRINKPSRRTSGGGKSQIPVSPTPGGSRPGAGGIKLPLWLVIGIAILYFIFSYLFGGEEEVANQAEPTGVSLDFVGIPTKTTEPVIIENTKDYTGDQTWLVMLYQDADDKILEKDIYIDLNEAEKVGSTSNVHIVAQVDRFSSGYAGDGDWTSTRRYYVKKDDDLSILSSELIEDLGEINMSDGQTLVDFATWAIQNYPADKHVLILSDHGMGWPGGWSDPSPGGTDPNPAPLATKLGDHLFLNEIDDALGDIRTSTGIEKFEIIGFDACLMAQLEVFSALTSHTRYAIASEETEPALGWAYTGFLSALVSNPDLGGDELSREVVNSYISQDQRILDPIARDEFTTQGSPLASLFGLGRASPEQLTQQISRGITLSAVDVDSVPDLLAALNEFSFALQNEDQAIIASARNYSRSYTSIFGREVPPSFLDLGHFVQLVQRETKESSVQVAAERVLDELVNTVIAEKHGSDKQGSTGITIYFPNSTLFRSPVTGLQSYTMIADKFAASSLWDEFLVYHYQNRKFNIDELTTNLPPSDVATRAPGQGSITVSDIQLSSSTTSPGNPIDLSVDIDGTNIGYIKFFLGFLDQDANSIFIMDTDFLESPETYELNGVYYPKWAETGSFTIDFNWDPYIFAISDGESLIPAHFQPEVYGATAEDAIYSVEGIFTFSNGGESLYARLFFRNGMLQNLLGFTGQADAGAPREIVPQAGDTFIVLNRWMDLDSSGNVHTITQVQGDQIIFGENPITWQEVYTAEGQYVLGIIIEDLDGNKFPVYSLVSVE